MVHCKILVAHERVVIAQAIRRVLAAQGFEVVVVGDGDAVARALRDSAWHGLVVDVGLHGPAVHDLVALAKTGGAAPVRAVVLIASVFRRSSYKRRPQQLYGADDYVEVHQLGDQLPSKLWRLLDVDPSGLDGLMEAESLLCALQDEARRPDHAGRAAAAGQSDLAELLVADLVLYSGDKLADAESADETHVALAPELEAAREVYRGVFGELPRGPEDPISAALDALLRAPDHGRGELKTGGGART
jgi:CheY-like chemotaxis protein